MCKDEGYNPAKYWEQEMHFCGKKEFLIYQYLCGDLKGNKIKKVEENLRYTSYSKWNEHVKDIIKGKEKSKIEEFYHFLRHKKRLCDITDGLISVLAMPVTVAILAGYLVSQIADPEIPQLLNVSEIASVCGGSGFLQKIVVLVIYISIVLILGSVIVVFIVLPLYLLLSYIVKTFFVTKQEILFWEDLIEIVKKELKNKALGNEII